MDTFEAYRKLIDRGRIERNVVLDQVARGTLQALLNGFFGDKERSANAGFAAHVSKPYEIEALVDLIGSLVAKNLPGAI